MTNQHIANSIKEISVLLSDNLEEALLQDLQVNAKSYAIDEAFEFKRDLIETANKIRIVLLDQSLAGGDLATFIKDVNIPLIALRQSADGFAPVILTKEKRAIKVVEIGEVPS